MNPCARNVRKLNFNMQLRNKPSISVPFETQFRLTLNDTRYVSDVTKKVLLRMAKGLVALWRVFLVKSPPCPEV